MTKEIKVCLALILGGYLSFMGAFTQTIQLNGYDLSSPAVKVAQ